jgi:ribosomal RNA-processing protein 1
LFLLLPQRALLCQTIYIPVPMSKAEEAQKELYRRLAHNDKHIRDRGVKMLKNFLSKRRQLNEIGMMKIWKAVFYCFWMSDKTPIQMELAERLAGLLHEQNEEQALLYLKCFWLTIGREWNNVDRLRF